MTKTALVLAGIMMAGMTVCEVHAQGASYLQGLFIGSDGTPAKQAPGAEESLEGFHNEFLQSMGFRSRGNTVLALSALTEQSVFDRIAALPLSTDSGDVVIAVALGGWQKDPTHSEFSALFSVHPDKLTVDYFLNFMLFLPVRTTVVFILAPRQHPFPLDIFQGQRAGVGGGGKYLVVLQPKNQEDFDTTIDAFHDIVEKTGEAGSGDRNSDGFLSFTEWLSLFEQLSTPEFTVLSYRIVEGPDVQLKQLQ